MGGGGGGGRIKNGMTRQIKNVLKPHTWKSDLEILGSGDLHGNPSHDTVCCFSSLWHIIARAPRDSNLSTIKVAWSPDYAHAGELHVKGAISSRRSGKVDVWSRVIPQVSLQLSRGPPSRERQWLVHNSLRLQHVTCLLRLEMDFFISVYHMTSK